MGQYEKSLSNAFFNCAPFCHEPPDNPLQGQGVQVIKREMHTQLLCALVELLAQNYGLRDQLNGGSLLARCFPARSEGATNRMCVFAANEDISAAKIVEWRKLAEPFIKNIRECASRCDGVSVVLAENVEVLDIHYVEPEEMWKTLWVLADNIHPDNSTAMSHIRSIVHLYDRLFMGGRGRHLC